jgi:hypothetical protein
LVVVDDETRQISTVSQLTRATKMAVEDGQQIHLSLGSGGLYGISGAPALVGVGILNAITRIISNSDRPVVATSGNGMFGILSQDVQRRAYQEAGNGEFYTPANGQICGLTPFSYAAGALTVLIDQQAATNILLGNFGSEVGLLSDASEQSGAQLIGGSDSLTAQAVLYAASTEPIVGEELYTLGANFAPGSWQQISLKTQDVLRWVVIGLIVGGLILKIVGLM